MKYSPPCDRLSGGRRLRRRGGFLQKTAAALFVEAIAVALDGDDVAVVEQAIEDGRDDDRISEDRAPFPDGPVRRTSTAPRS